MLLKKARNRADEISYLICEMKVRIAPGTAHTALKKAAELLKIKHGHPRAQSDPRNTPATATGWPRTFGPLRQVTQAWSQGGSIAWSSWPSACGICTVMTAVIVIYLNEAALVIDVRDTGIKVEVLAQGSAVTITGPNNERIEVTPGEQHLKIEYAGLETVTTSLN